MHRKVEGGHPLRRNRRAPSGDAVLLAGTAVAFERRRPGPAFRHLLRRADLERFIALLPDWDELATGLDRVILDAGNGTADGWCGPGTVALRAWNRELWTAYPPGYVEAHRGIIDRLGVAVREPIDGCVTVEWTEPAARGFQLLHVLLHELGHHHDRMRTRKRLNTGRGEAYAETYANRYADRIWQDYEAHFSA